MFFSFYSKNLINNYYNFSPNNAEDVLKFLPYLTAEHKLEILQWYLSANSYDLAKLDNIFAPEDLSTFLVQTDFEYAYLLLKLDLDLLIPSFLTHLPLTKYISKSYYTIPYLGYFDVFNFSFAQEMSYKEFAIMMEFTNYYDQYTKFIFCNPNWYTVDFYLVIPEIFFFFSLLLILIFVVMISFNSKIKFIVNITGVHFICLFLLYINTFSVFFDIFYFSVTSNFYIYSCKLLIIFFSFIFLWLIASFMHLDKYIISFEYVFIYTLVVYSLIFLMSVNDFLGLFLSLELQSLSLYILATYKTTSSFSTEAGIKYFILGAIASGMILFGISVLYGLSGSINFNDLAVFSSFLSLDKIYYPTTTIWHNLGGVLPAVPYLYFGTFDYSIDTMLLFYKNMEITYFIGFLFIIIGLFFKLGIAPFHMWLPDVYEGAPLISTALFALIPKIALIFLLIRFSAFHFFFDSDVWFFIFTGCGILSIFIGTFGALLQTKIKRLFAYSAIGHMGFILISLANFTVINYMITFAYGLTYIILNLSFFSILISLRKLDGTELKDIRELSSLFKNNKVLAIFLSLNLFSIAGIPPLFGFYSKWLILLSLINNDLWFIAIIILVLSMISVYYYIKLIKILFFELNDNFIQFIIPGRFLSYIIILSGFLNIFFMLFANLFFTEILNIVLYLL